MLAARTAASPPRVPLPMAASGTFEANRQGNAASAACSPDAQALHAGSGGQPAISLTDGRHGRAPEWLCKVSHAGCGRRTKDLDPQG